MIYISYIRTGLLSAALSLTTAIATPAIAQTIPAQTTAVSMPQLTPDQIAQDVRPEFNNRTGQREWIAPTFDPFEEDPSMAGSVNLRSTNQAVSIDGQRLSNGAVLDIGFYYNSPSADPYDTRGFDEVIFLNGEIAPAIRRDNRVLECSSNVRETVYDHRTYYAPRVSFNFFRPHRYYIGHFGYPGYRRSVFGGAYGSRGYRNRGYGYSNYGYGTRGGTYRDYRGDRDRDRRGDRDRRDRDDRGDRVRDDRADGRRGVQGRGVGRATPEQRRQLIRDGQGRSPDSYRRATREQRLTNRAEPLDASALRDRRTRIQREQRAEDRRRADRAADRGNRSTRATRNTTPRHQVHSDNRVRGEDRARRNDTRQSEARPNRDTRPATARGPRGERRSSTVRVNRAAPSTVKSAPAPKARKAPSRSNESRSSSSRSNRSSNRASKSQSKPSRAERGNRGGKRMNFFPNDYGYGGRDVVTSVDVDCAREETLSVFIPNERLDAARFDGMTLIALDREGREYPIFVPPNYIDGFRLASGSGLRNSNAYPQSVPATPYTQPLNCPTGTTAQPNGTCMVTSGTYSGYP